MSKSTTQIGAKPLPSSVSGGQPALRGSQAAVPPIVATGPKVIQDVGEEPLVLYSDIRAPLASLSFLRRSLAMAELALISYNDEAEAKRAAEAIGFPEAQLFENDGSQAFRFRNEYDVVLACRGTEPNEWNDLKADANAVMSVLGTIGNVHSGFNREVDDLWPLLEELLRGSEQPVWFCGHSLGGAMATICAYRCTTSQITKDPQELHTFGSPRVGCKRYIRHAQLNHFRWVHNNDVVTRCPPAWMGYRHCGSEVYLDRYGRIRKLTGILRSRDRWRGFIGGLFQWRLDMLSDHSIGLYAGHIAKAVMEEDAAGGDNRAAKTSEHFAIANNCEAPTSEDAPATP